MNASGIVKTHSNEVARGQSSIDKSVKGFCKQVSGSLRLMMLR